MLSHLEQGPLQREELRRELADRQSECRVCAKHPWVIRCAHLGKASVTLRDYEHPEYLRLYGDVKEKHRFGVVGFQHPYGPTFEDSEPDSLPAALAAFEQAEQEMLNAGEDQDSD